MIVLDTSFLVAFFNEDDSFHFKAVSEMKNLEKETQLISDYVINETATVLNYKAGLEKAVAFIEGVKNKENIELYYSNENDFESTAGIFKRQKRKLSFTGASIIHTALSTRSKIATFDENIIKEFERLAKK
jgi:predicted nucleic acid-binding protein